MAQSAIEVWSAQREALLLTCPVLVTNSGIQVAPAQGRQKIGLTLSHLMLLERLGAGSSVDRALDEVVEVTNTRRHPLKNFLRELGDRGGAVFRAVDRAVSSPLQPEEAAVLDSTLTQDVELHLRTPWAIRVGRTGFEAFDHDGRLQLALTAVELLAAAGFRNGATCAAAFAQHRLNLQHHALDSDGFDRLVGRLTTTGLLTPARQSPSRGRSVEHVSRVKDYLAQSKVRDRAQNGHGGRTKVVPVHTNPSLPLALGLVVAYAKAYEGGRLERLYDFRTVWQIDAETVEQLAEEPSVFLFSNYIWSSNSNLALSALVKKVNPSSVTIHGGPNTPKYESDIKEFLDANPHVDIMVRGEGELTAARTLEALADGLAKGTLDRKALRSVEGICFKDGEDIVRTPDRPRITDLDGIPSPYLTGMFDDFVQSIRPGGAVVETNRGCPYGCTFCDWGSDTLSKIRKFSMERVMAELEWCSTNHIAMLGIADANFGVFERDIAIAAKAAELKRTTGFPAMVGTNYAKNTSKHLETIVSTMAEAGIRAHGIVSLQSLDATTLDAIARKNIKLAKYDELANTFRAARLPLYAELMMGLPGSTRTSFQADLQACVDRELHTKVNPTQLLPNSPMNDPVYRKKHGISAKPGLLVMQTNTFTNEDYALMEDLRRIFLLADGCGMLRQIMRYVRRETGVHEIHFLERLRMGVRSESERYPVLRFVFDLLPDVLVEPISWQFFIDEVRDYLLDVIGLPDDAALATVLDVQHALLLSRDRSFPDERTLPHDFGEWHRLVLKAKREHSDGDWTRHVPCLRELPPGAFTVDDPEGVCQAAWGRNVRRVHLNGAWELASPVSRQVLAAY